MSKDQVSFVCGVLFDSIKTKSDENLIPYIKTSTGFNGEGAKESDVEHIKSLIIKESPGKFLIKASGGIRTLYDAQKMLNAGADILGCSSSANIIQELKNGT